MKQTLKNDIMTYLRSIKPVLEADGIDRIGIFGSVARGEDDILSDIDIMIHTTPLFVQRFRGVKGFLYLDALRKKIAVRFGRKVDICDEAGLQETHGKVLYA